MAPVRTKINFFILLNLLVVGSVRAEIPPSNSSAIDQYISERKRIQSQAAPVVDKLGTQALTKLDDMEKRLFPIIVFIDRQNAEILSGEASIDRAMKELKEQSKFNPYDDKDWVAKSHKDLQQLCCEIKADPRRQQQIINRVSQGLPPLGPPGGPGRGGPGAQGRGGPQGQGMGLGQRGGGGAGAQGGGQRMGQGRGGGAQGGGQRMGQGGRGGGGQQRGGGAGRGGGGRGGGQRRGGG